MRQSWGTGSAKTTRLTAEWDLHGSVNQRDGKWDYGLELIPRFETLNLARARCDIRHLQAGRLEISQDRIVGEGLRAEIFEGNVEIGLRLESPEEGGNWLGKLGIVAERTQMVDICPRAADPRRPAGTNGFLKPSWTSSSIRISCA